MSPKNASGARKANRAGAHDKALGLSGKSIFTNRQIQTALSMKQKRFRMPATVECGDMTPLLWSATSCRHEGPIPSPH
jgi:hypothetical protein